MSIRYGLLALLDGGPRYGSQLRSEFESRTGDTWPLNIGQVYTTLSRLERDGLITPQPGGDPKQHLYAITPAGRAELAGWFARPVDRTQPARDELAIKLAMAVGVPGVDVSAVIQAQRTHTLRAMQDYTRLKARALAGPPESTDEVAWLLVLEQLIFAAEAEVRWLDHCESRLVRLAARHQPAGPAEPADPPDPPDPATAAAAAGPAGSGTEPADPAKPVAGPAEATTDHADARGGTSL